MREAADEVERLRHDIARHVAIACELATECERLRAENADLRNANQILRDALGAERAELAALRAALEAMRVAGGAAEFQRAFDEAKIIAARKGEGDKC